MSSVAIIDYGMGNLHSIAKAVQHADSRIEVTVTDDRDTILRADRVIFPGVGAIRDCMEALTSRDLIPVIREAAATRPFLGICLGMQALLDSSEENNGTACLGLIPGQVVRFADGLVDGLGHPLKIPHMGWNQVEPTIEHPLWHRIEPGTSFYFVHSYYAQPTDTAHIAATTEYPGPFASALAHGNIFAVQFHPEKSQAAGLRLLGNFLGWTGH